MMSTLTQGGETTKAGTIIRAETTTVDHLTTTTITPDTTHSYEMTTEPNTRTDPVTLTNDHGEIQISHIEQRQLQQEIKQTIIMVGIICIFVYMLVNVN